jgi:multisubunit Na+/H+ antiporter MnhB subunit
MRLAAFTSLAILGLTALLLVLVNDSRTAAQGAPYFESNGLTILGVAAILVVVVAALGGKQSCVSYAFVPLTLGASIVGLAIGTCQPS